MLADFHHERGFVREIDLFIVGTVLQYLTLKKHIAAAVALQSYAHKVSHVTFFLARPNPRVSDSTLLWANLRKTSRFSKNGHFWAKLCMWTKIRAQFDSYEAQYKAQLDVADSNKLNIQYY